MRIGIFGGTFDPPHLGHLLAASDAHEALRLDTLTFVPAARQPLKAARTAATGADRCRMLALALGDDPRFSIDEIEIHRGGLSFTVDTLEALAVQSPSDERFLLLGSDVIESFPRWREPQRVARLARLVILRRARDGADGTVSGIPGEEEIVQALQSSIGNDAPAPIVLATRRIDVSSTEIRERARLGRSLLGFVPDAVRRYIDERGLYR